MDKGTGFEVRSAVDYQLVQKVLLITGDIMAGSKRRIAEGSEAGKL